jgi:hypothetical protein
MFAKKTLSIKGGDVDLSLSVRGGFLEIPNVTRSRLESDR